MSRGKSADRKKPARVASGPEAPGFARSLGENTGRVLRLFLPLALMLGVVAGLSFLLWRCVGRAGVAGAAAKTESSDATARLTGVQVRQAVLQHKRPAWISREDFEQVADTGMFAQGHSVFEAGLSHTLAERYQTSPWVECVRAVRLRYPAQMELEIDWRKPAARVDRPSMVLDRHGVVLNLMADNAAVRDIPLIAGLAPARVEVGRKVGEKELAEALDLIETVKDALASSPGQLKVASAQREAAGTWRIVTDRGPCIYWGYYTDDPPMDEPRTREKASLLRRRLCEMKDPALFEYVKVYHAQAPVKARGATGSGDGGAPVVTQVPGGGRSRR
ncbi:MAG: cell division protein FtsQ/DivIB [Planctomycetota bacterium]|nr:cell division protein FtsQ/DivIB [Planctomycetota bacterium]